MLNATDACRIAGFDMGRNYVAWARAVQNERGNFVIDRHGLLYPPDLGDTDHFGLSLPFWGFFFDHFVRQEICARSYGVERFTYAPGSKGSAAEDINLRVAQMTGPGCILVRNTDWKSWFHKNIHEKGTLDYFGFPTPHECDAAGIALYTASRHLGQIAARPKTDESTQP